MGPNDWPIMMMMIMMNDSLDSLTGSPPNPTHANSTAGNDRIMRSRRTRDLGRSIVRPLRLLLLLLLSLVCGDGVSVGQRAQEQRGERKLALSKKVKSIGCHRKHKRKEVSICAADAFRVAIAQEPNALVLLRAGAAATAATGWQHPRQLQAAGNELVLSTAALVVIENDLVMQGTLTIGNVTISEDDTSALQGPPGKHVWGLGWGVGETGAHRFGNATDDRHIS
jgi:hypothetical protein